MSVLAYLYPRDLDRLDLETVMGSVCGEASGFSVEELERRPRSTPNWFYLLLSHSSHKQLRFEFVLENNKKSNIEWLAERYAKSRNFAVAREAKRYIWTKIRGGSASDRELSEGFRTHDLVIWQLAKLSSAVIDLPENGKLVSCSGFARHRNSK